MISKTISLLFEEATYQIELSVENGTVRVQAFTADHQPCGFEYSVTLPKDYYLDALLESEVVKALIEQAKRDVTDGRWSRDLAALEEGVVANRIDHSDDWQSRPGFIVHTDVFDRPITKERYQEFLERMDYFGFPIEGYGVGPVRQADSTGRAWIYLHSSSCD